jgi:hypothetical protein
MNAFAQLQIQKLSTVSQAPSSPNLQRLRELLGVLVVLFVGPESNLTNLLQNRLVFIEESRKRREAAS